jgi:hypothetical protein
MPSSQFNIKKHEKTDLFTLEVKNIQFTCSYKELLYLQLLIEKMLKDNPEKI